MRRLFWLTWIGLTLCAASPSVVSAASPSIVVFYGGPLESPVVMTDEEDIALLVGEVAAAPTTPPEDLVKRQFVRIALFWGTEVPSRTRSRQRLNGLRITDADQFGRAFLGSKREPPAIDLPWYGDWPRELSPTARQLLARYGVPTSSASSGVSTLKRLLVPLALGLSSATLLVMLGGTVLRKRLRVRSLS